MRRPLFAVAAFLFNQLLKKPSADSYIHVHKSGVVKQPLLRVSKTKRRPR
ncbi:hypothetical protein [Thalassospira tepidiphila]